MSLPDSLAGLLHAFVLVRHVGNAFIFDVLKSVCWPAAHATIVQKAAVNEVLFGEDPLFPFLPHEILDNGNGSKCPA